MTDYLFPPAPTKSLAVQGSDQRYPVNRIFCVGRNYAEHAAEMGYEVDREKAFYFLKGPHALVLSGAETPYPPGTQNYHFEVELVLALKAPLFRASLEEARAAIGWYGVGLDMTRRDLQVSEREKKRPWDLGKDVEDSCVMGALTPAEALDDFDARRIWLTQNGALKQEGRLGDLVWKCDEILAHLSGFYHLAPGDLVMTGTPAGVGPVAAGDQLEGMVEGLDPVRLAILAPE